LHEAGWTGKAIATALGVTEGAVSQWVQRAREGDGREALRTKPRLGARPKLTADQQAQLPALLAKGAPWYDFIGDVWTADRIAVVIKRTFGVSYHPAHITRLMRRIGWSPQKPLTRASQRDEDAIRAWPRETWPALQAKRRPRTARSCS
jgi:transposase